jgi:hypothetical protein
LIATIFLLQVARAGVVYSNDFNDDPVGTYSTSNLAEDWNGPSWNDGVSAGRVTVVEGPEAYEGRSIRCRYPANTVDMVQWILRLGREYDELYLSYRVMFNDPFEFRLGGKLPGLCGEACNAGGDIPDGTDGFEAIMMWLEDGRLIQYVYHPDQPGQWGHGMDWDIGGQRYAEPGTWHQIEHYVKINTPGQYDGIIKGWFDGELALEKTGMRFRTVDDWAVNSFFFQTHFGGSGSEWEPRTDQYTYFDDFVISTERVGDSGGGGGGGGGGGPEGDVNADGSVDIFDLVLVAQNFGLTSGFDTRADLNSDGTVDIFDLVTVAQNFGKSG